MANIKIWVENNMVNFEQGLDIQPLGRASVEARYTDTKVTFYHTDKGYLKDFDTVGKDGYFLYTEIQNDLGNPVGATKELIRQYLSDKIGNFKQAGGTAVPTPPAGVNGDVQINSAGSFGVFPNGIFRHDTVAKQLVLEDNGFKTGSYVLNEIVNVDFEGGTISPFVNNPDLAAFGWVATTEQPINGSYSMTVQNNFPDLVTAVEISHTLTSELNAFRFNYNAIVSQFGSFLMRINGESVLSVSDATTGDTLSDLYFLTETNNTISFNFSRDVVADKVFIDDFIIYDVVPTFEVGGYTVIKDRMDVTGTLTSTEKINANNLDVVNGEFRLDDGAGVAKIHTIGFGGISRAQLEMYDASTYRMPRHTSAIIDSGDGKTIVIKEYLTNVVKSNVATLFTSQQNFSIATLTAGSTIAWDCATQQSAKVTLNQNATLSNATNVVEGGFYNLTVGVSATPFTLSFDTNYIFGEEGAPVLSTTANNFDEISFRGTSTGKLKFLGIKKGFDE